MRQILNQVIEFRDTGSGELVDVGTVKFDLDMNMPGMVMHKGATIEPTSTPGKYRAKVKPDMAGDWTATLRFDGPHGDGNISFSEYEELFHAEIGKILECSAKAVETRLYRAEFYCGKNSPRC